MLIARHPIGTISFLGGVMSNPRPFTWAWGQMVQFNNEHLCGPDEYVHQEPAETTDRSWARNTLAARFLGDWLLMLDIDHSFEPDICARMVGTLESYHIDVLTGLYYSKTPPYPPMIHWFDQSADDGKGAYRIIAEWPQTARLIEISRSGGGCLLVRRSVFDRIRDELREQPFDLRPGLWRSEDFSFYARLRDLGIKSYCAPQIEARHLTYHPLTGSDFDIEEMETYGAPQQQ